MYTKQFVKKQKNKNIWHATASATQQLTSDSQQVQVQEEEEPEETLEQQLVLVCFYSAFNVLTVAIVVAELTA